TPARKAASSRRRPGATGYPHAIHHRVTTTDLADACRCAPNLAWMSYLKGPYGMAAVTLVEAFHEVLRTGGKHVSASAAARRGRVPAGPGEGSCRSFSRPRSAATPPPPR